MKNISRRVFIKGMAVAAAATAASTVLAGCNFVPEKDETVVVPTPSNSYTYTDKDGKTVTVSASKYELNTKTAKDSNLFDITLDVKNNTKSTVGVIEGGADRLSNSANTGLSKGDYYVVVGNITFYGKEGQAIESAVKVDASTDFKDNMVKYTSVSDFGTAVVAGTSESGLIRYTIKDSTVENWASAKVTLTLNEVYTDSDDKKIIDQVGKDIEFTFNK